MPAFFDRTRKPGVALDEVATPSILEMLGFRGHQTDATFHVLLALRKVAKTLPGLMAAYLVAGLLIVAAGLTRGLDWIAPLLAAAVGPVLIALGVYGLLHSALGGRFAQSGRIRLTLAVAALIAGLQGWAFGAAMSAGAGDPYLLAAIVAMATFATLATLSTLPLAAGLFLAVYAVAALAAAGQVAYLPGGFGLLLTLMPVGVALIRADQAELRRRARDHYAGAKAGALVSMYEESGKVWFWETDRHGKLTYVSPLLAGLFDRTADALLGTPMNQLVVNGDDGDHASPQGERTIGFYLSSRLSFNDLQVRANLPGEVRWWTMTGRPILDSRGQFRGFRGTGSDFTEKRRSEAEISRLARLDALTGLPNRAVMFQLLEQSLANARVNGAACALLLLDLDRFKSVNDTLGHPVGDSLLKLVATRLEKVIAEKGRVGRLGGDEFNVVLPVAPSQSALSALADEIIWQLSQPYMIDGSHVSIGATVGIATGPTDGETADALFRNADLALYAAKADGKGVHRFYLPSMHAEAERRRLLETELRTALADDGLHVVYQPVVCANAERIVGFEALVRWTHPVYGAISPVDFIPIAEEIGMIQAIGEWVLRTACHEAAQWPSHVRVAVNVSPTQFANPSLPSVVMNALASARLDPARLELEITESVFLNEGADTDAMFSKLKAIGVRLALDDFGTGYSALGYLRKAPFDKIKIDRSFVQGAAVPGSRNAAIVKAIVSLADSLNMDTTAEGAETLDELALIRSLGCSHIQGYIFGQPMRARQAAERLGRIAEPIAAEGFRRSRAPRIAMLRSAILHAGRQAHSVRIRNISSSGARIEIARSLPDGTRVIVDFGGGMEVEAVVCWSHAEALGVSFLRSIDVEDVASVRPRQRAIA